MGKTDLGDEFGQWHGTGIDAMIRPEVRLHVRWNQFDDLGLSLLNLESQRERVGVHRRLRRAVGWHKSARQEASPDVTFMMVEPACSCKNGSKSSRQADGTEEIGGHHCFHFSKYLQTPRFRGVISLIPMEVKLEHLLDDGDSPDIPMPVYIGYLNEIRRVAKEEH